MRRGWWIVPVALVSVIVVVWLILAGLPLRRTDQVRRTPPAAETIAEGTVAAPARPPDTGTLIDLPSEELLPPSTATVPTTTVPASPAPAPTPAPAAVPPAVIVEERPREAIPPPMASASAAISEGEASSVLSRFLGSGNRYRDVSRECVEVRGEGYRNAGYGFSVWDACVRGGGARRLGRWRVDAMTREVFEQQEDGRYQRP